MKNSAKILIFSMFVMTVISCGKESKSNKITLENVQVVNEIDPVCGMSTKEHLKDTITYTNKLYGFCSANCKEEFQKNPKEFMEE